MALVFNDDTPLIALLEEGPTGKAAVEQAPGGCEGTPSPGQGRCVASPGTPPPPPAKFSVSEALELGQHILEDHGGGSLRRMHERSLGGTISSLDLLQTSERARSAAIDFLTEAFEHYFFRDEWLASVVALLDRIAVASAQSPRPPVTAGQAPGSKEEAFAEWLAAALCVLKLSPAEAELETMSVKDIIMQFVGRSHRSSSVWKQIVDAEFRIYRLLNYHVALPTAHDIAVRIALEVCAAGRRAEAVSDKPQWAGLAEENLQAPRDELTMPTPRFTLLASFLVEIAMAHLYMKVYRDSAPPAALAFAALHLSLHSFGDIPPRCAKALENADQRVFRQEDGNRFVPFLVKAIYKLWQHPPQESMVMKKWNNRNCRDFGKPLPKAPEELWPSCGPADMPVMTPERKHPPKEPSRPLSRSASKQLPAASLAVPAPFAVTIPIKDEPEPAGPPDDAQNVGSLVSHEEVVDDEETFPILRIIQQREREKQRLAAELKAEEAIASTPPEASTGSAVEPRVPTPELKTLAPVEAAVPLTSLGSSKSVPSYGNPYPQVPMPNTERVSGATGVFWQHRLGGCWTVSCGSINGKKREAYFKPENVSEEAVERARILAVHHRRQHELQRSNAVQKKNPSNLTKVPSSSRRPSRARSSPPKPDALQVVSPDSLAMQPFSKKPPVAACEPMDTSELNLGSQKREAGSNVIRIPSQAGLRKRRKVDGKENDDVRTLTTAVSESKAISMIFREPAPEIPSLGRVPDQQAPLPRKRPPSSTSTLAKDIPAAKRIRCASGGSDSVVVESTAKPLVHPKAAAPFARSQEEGAELLMNNRPLRNQSNRACSNQQVSTGIRKPTGLSVLFQDPAKDCGQSERSLVKAEAIKAIKGERCQAETALVAASDGAPTAKRPQPMRKKQKKRPRKIFLTESGFGCVRCRYAATGCHMCNDAKTKRWIENRKPTGDQVQLLLSQKAKLRRAQEEARRRKYSFTNSKVKLGGLKSTAKHTEPAVLQSVQAAAEVTALVPLPAPPPAASPPGAHPTNVHSPHVKADRSPPEPNRLNQCIPPTRKQRLKEMKQERMRDINQTSLDQFVTLRRNRVSSHPSI